MMGGILERVAVMIVVAVSVLAGLGVALAVNDEPLQQNWTPTERGPNDKAGAVNRTTPAIVLEAMKLVKRGKVATLGKPYQSDAPAFGARSWKV